MSLNARFEPLKVHEEPKPACFCYQCGEALFHSEKAYDCDDGIFCEYCGFDHLTDKMDELETSYEIGEICFKCKDPFDDDGYRAFAEDGGELFCEVCTEEIIFDSAVFIIDKEVR